MQKTTDNMTALPNTIAAVATPLGAGGIAVIRISGPRAVSIAERILKCKEKLTDRRVILAELDTGSVRDDAVVLYFKAPRSFTGEDVVEIQCHGGMFLTQKIVEALIQNGCRAAEPGEFTRRAYLNGKLDLTKAEGILDLIEAKSESAANAAYGALSGGVFEPVGALQTKLAALIAGASAAIDYPEEDLTEPAKRELLRGIESIAKKLEILGDSFANGRILREGVRVAIAGEPNAGKSLLLNRLLGVDRAIVTDEAGTTRDTVEESFLYRGVRFVLIDTAGIRDAETQAEKLGIERSRRALRSADFILAVYETGKTFAVELPADKPVLYVCNKLDLAADPKCLKNARNRQDTVCISALTGENIEALKEEIFARTAGKIDASGVTLGSNRQLTAVAQTLACLSRAQAAADSPIECMLSDLNEAYRILGSVTGATASDQIIDEIFKRFCVGK